jgi:Domain of unknown function (DUF4258)
VEKRVRFDRHARRRMQWRGISEEEVMQVLNSPDNIEPSIKGRTNVFKMVGAKYLKVTYRELSEELLVISVVNKP